MGPIVAWLGAPAFSRGAWRSASLPVLVFALGAAVLIALFAGTPTITMTDGLGGDGFMYAQWIRAYKGDPQALSLNPYSSQRILAIVIVRGALDALRADTTTAHIVLAFRVMNTIALVGALGAQVLSAKHLALTRAGLLAMVGFTFVHYAGLSFLPFNPVLTDSLAVLSGALVVLFYVARRPIALACVTVAASFVWPGFVYVGGPLLFLPRRAAGRGPAPAPAGGEPADAHPLDTILAVVGAGITAYFASQHAMDVSPYKEVPLAQGVYRLSLGIATVLAFTALRSVVRVRPLLRELARRDRDAIVGKVLAVLAFVLVSRGIAWVAAHPTQDLDQQVNYDIRLTLVTIAGRTVQRPAIFVWAHASYFGVLAVVVVLRWRHVCASARSLGAGAWAVLGVTLPLVFNHESRGLFQVLPLFAPLAVLACARLPWTVPRLFELAALAAAASKIWYQVVQTPVFDAVSYHAHNGPWMSDGQVAAHAIGAIAAGCWFVWMSRQEPPGAERIALVETPT